MEQSKEAPREQKRSAETASLAEVEWFFTSAKGKVPRPGEATAEIRKIATRIQEWLNAIPTFHVGALSLRFTPRDWPRSIQGELGVWTSLMVRLECAAHPSGGRISTSALETAAVLRLQKMLATGRSEPALVRHERHAAQHVTAAIRAYVKVRGDGPSVLPCKRKVAA